MKLRLDEPKVKQWTNRLESAGCKINSITPLSIQEKRNSELLFAYVSADVTAPEGYPINPIIFIRGDAVIVVPFIRSTETGRSFLLMVKQRRIASGEIHYEFPAGMLDRDIKNPAKTALKELAEETGLHLEESSLFRLSSEMLYSSPGACDERIAFYGTKIHLSEEEIDELRGRLAGNPDENEKIEVAVVTVDFFLNQNRSIQALLAWNLFKESEDLF